MKTEIPIVTQKQIDALLKASEIKVETIFEKVTLVAVKLPCGFVLTESAGSVSKENYNEGIGTAVCFKKIVTKLWQFEGYALSKATHSAPSASSAVNPTEPEPEAITPDTIVTSG